MDSEMKRGAVMEMLKNNQSYNDIKKSLNVNRKFIYRCKKRLEENVGSARRPGPRRHRPVRTKSLFKAMANNVHRNPARSINKMAKKYKVSRRTLQRVVREDLGLQPYKVQRRQLLSDATKSKRLERSKVLKKWLAENPDVVVIYSDEKLFDIERKFNGQNDRIYTRDINSISPSVKFAFKRQKPDSIMIWAAVASNGKKSPIFRIPDGVKINQTVYLDFLKEKVKPWIDSEFPNVKVCFTQDSAPAHGANRVQEWCQNEFHHFWTKVMWPPSSPDLNPLDFAM